MSTRAILQLDNYNPDRCVSCGGTGLLHSTNSGLSAEGILYGHNNARLTKTCSSCQAPLAYQGLKADNLIGIHHSAKPSIIVPAIRESLLQTLAVGLDKDDVESFGLTLAQNLEQYCCVKTEAIAQNIDYAYILDLTQEDFAIIFSYEIQDLSFLEKDFKEVCSKSKFINATKVRFNENIDTALLPNPQ